MGEKQTLYNSAELEKWDKEYLWHPFTQMKDYREEEPLIIARGEGSFLYDIRGNRYLDGVSSLWVNLHGHGREEINQAISNQMQEIGPLYPAWSLKRACYHTGQKAG